MNERKDIRIGPEYPWITFGDGHMAQVVGVTYSKNNQGMNIIELTMRPSKELIKRYEIPQEMLDVDLCIKKEYPLVKVRPLNLDPAWTRYFCFLTFDGKTAPETESWEGNIEAEKIMGMERMNNLLKAENAKLTEENIMLKTNLRKHLKENVIGIASEMGVSMMPQYPPGTPQFTTPVRNE